MLLIDQEKVYQLACAGCTRHGEKPGECYHDEPCERLIFALTTAEPVDAVEVVRCKECRYCDPERHYCDHPMSTSIPIPRKTDDFCSYGERRPGDA